MFTKMYILLLFSCALVLYLLIFDPFRNNFSYFFLLYATGPDQILVSLRGTLMVLWSLRVCGDWSAWLRCMWRQASRQGFSGLISRCSLPGHSLPGPDTPCPERFPLQIGYMQPTAYTPAPLHFLWWGLNEGNCSLLGHCAVFVCLCKEFHPPGNSNCIIAASQPVDM